MKLEYTMKEALDKQIISYFYGGLSIADITQKMKITIQSIDNNIKKLSDVRGYVCHVIYNYQMTNN